MSLVSAIIVLDQHRQSTTPSPPTEPLLQVLTSAVEPASSSQSPQGQVSSSPSTRAAPTPPGGSVPLISQTTLQYPKRE